MNSTEIHPSNGAPAFSKERPLSGKVALVTGAGSGIGLAAAQAYARKGAAVVLAGRRAAPLQAAADAIVSAGGDAAAISADVSNEADIRALVARTVERFGSLDIAFNNAAVSSYGLIEQLTAEEFDRVIATNFRGVWLLIREEIAQMRKGGRGGAIVNTSSIAATGGTAGLSIYASSKAALDAMVRVLALETGSDGIRINNVSPGLTRTPMNDGLPPVMVEQVAAHSALGRIAEPEDIANAAVWLSGSEADFITGQSLLVDGGFNIAGRR